MNDAQWFIRLLSERISGSADAEWRPYPPEGADSPARARIAYDLLSKALNTSRLVRVQRPVTRGGKTFMTHKWVRPEKVRKTDTVIGNHQVYNDWKAEQDGGGKVPAATKPDTQAVTGTSVSSGKPSGTSKLNAVLAKKRKAKADAARAAQSAAAGASKPAAKPAAQTTPATAKPVAQSAPATSKQTQPAQSKPSAPSKTRKKAAAKNTKSADTAAAKSTDTENEAGTPTPDTTKPAAESKPKSDSKKQSRTGTRDKEQLSPRLAKTEREKNLLEIINGISDPDVLQAAINTGVVAADADAYEFCQNELWQAYTMYNRAEGNNCEKNVTNIIESLRFSKSARNTGNGSDKAKVLADLTVGIGQTLRRVVEDDFAADVLNPCESFAGMALADVPGRPYAGTLHGLINAFDPPLLTLRKYDEFKGMEGVLKQIASQQPELAAECDAMIREWNGMVDSGIIDDYFNYGYFDFSASGADRDKYNTINGDIMHFFGMSLADDAGNEITDYASLTRSDKHRVHHKPKASPEREAVMSNLVIAMHAIEAHRNMERWSGYDTVSIQSLCTGDNAPPLPTVSLDFLKHAKEYRDAMPATGSTPETPPHIAQSMNCALQYAPVEKKGEFFKEHPSPIKDITYSLIDYALTESRIYDDLEKPKHVSFTPKDAQAMVDALTPHPMSLKQLRKEAFENATCSVRLCTEDEQAETFEQMDKDTYTGIDRNNKRTRESYDNRVLIKRRAFQMENSKMEEAFWKLVDEQGLDVITAYNGISFNGFCGVCKSGFYRVPKGNEDCTAGSMLGFGIYIAFSPKKSMMYAGSSAFSGERLQYTGDDESYSDGFQADGVICIMTATLGKNHAEFDSRGRAYNANKNMGGDCDAVVCRAGSRTLLQADEACLTAANMLFPGRFVEVSSRVKEV